MNEKYLITHNNELSGQTNLPSFITFKANSMRCSPSSCSSDGLFAQQRTHRNRMAEDHDSTDQCFLSSDSSISTPDIVTSMYLNNHGMEELPCIENMDHQTNFWIKVNFLSPSSFFYKDVDKPSKAVKLSYLPKRDYPILYVERGRVIELTAETNFNLPTNSVMKFDIYSLKGTREEPVYGTSNDSIYNGSSITPNLCFIQAVEERKVAAYYLKSEDGFISMTVPMSECSHSFSVVFPFLNFKCQTSTKKIVFLRVSACNGSNIMATQTFQLVCCTSPNRDFKRHSERLSSEICPKISPKKMKTVPNEGCCQNPEVGQRSSTTGNPQYVIMTENYDIWKILHVVHQQLSVHFNSTKK